MDVDDLEQSIDGNLDVEDLQTPSDSRHTISNGTNNPCKMEFIEKPIVENPELSWSKQDVNQGSTVTTKKCDEFGIQNMKKSSPDSSLSKIPVTFHITTIPTKANVDMFMNMAIKYYESQGFLVEASILKKVHDYDNPININVRLKNLLEQNITDEKDPLEDVSISEVDNKIKDEERSNVGQEQSGTNNPIKMECIANPVVENTELACSNVRRHEIFK